MFGNGKLSFPPMFFKRFCLAGFGWAYLTMVYVINLVQRKGPPRKVVAVEEPSATLPVRSSHLLLAILACGILLTGWGRDPNARNQNCFNSGVEYLQKGKVKQAQAGFERLSSVSLGWSKST